MFFKDKVKYNDEEWDHPINSYIEKMKQEKEELEEYHKQLSFINLSLNYIISKYADSERKSFNIEFEKNKYGWWDNNYLIEAMNILFRDSLSNYNSFSKIEIQKYIKKLEAEMGLVNDRLNNITRELYEAEGK